eukprot:317622_1
MALAEGSDDLEAIAKQWGFSQAKIAESTDQLCMFIGVTKEKALQLLLGADFDLERAANHFYTANSSVNDAIVVEENSRSSSESPPAVRPPTPGEDKEKEKKKPIPAKKKEKKRSPSPSPARPKKRKRSVDVNENSKNDAEPSNSEPSAVKPGSVSSSSSSKSPVPAVSRPAASSPESSFRPSSSPRSSVNPPSISSRPPSAPPRLPLLISSSSRMVARKSVPKVPSNRAKSSAPSPPPAPVANGLPKPAAAPAPVIIKAHSRKECPIFPCARFPAIMKCDDCFCSLCPSERAAFLCPKWEAHSISMYNDVMKNKKKGNEGFQRWEKRSLGTITLKFKLVDKAMALIRLVRSLSLLRTALQSNIIENVVDAAHKDSSALLGELNSWTDTYGADSVRLGFPDRRAAEAKLKDKEGNKNIEFEVHFEVMLKRRSNAVITANKLWSRLLPRETFQKIERANAIGDRFSDQVKDMSMNGLLQFAEKSVGEDILDYDPPAGGLAAGNQPRAVQSQLNMVPRPPRRRKKRRRSVPDRSDRAYPGIRGAADASGEADKERPVKRARKPPISVVEDRAAENEADVRCLYCFLEKDAEDGKVWKMAPCCRQQAHYDCFALELPNEQECGNCSKRLSVDALLDMSNNSQPDGSDVEMKEADPVNGDSPQPRAPVQNDGAPSPAGSDVDYEEKQSAAEEEEDKTEEEEFDAAEFVVADSDEEMAVVENVFVRPVNENENIYGLNVELRPYQQQAVHWMYQFERNHGDHWERFWMKCAFPDGRGGPEDSVFYYSPYFHRISFEKPESPSGGFLLEEMGLGKTIETMALMQINPFSGDLPGPVRGPTGYLNYHSRATLIVAAPSLVGQWKTELETKLNRTITITQYYGGNRIRDPRRLAGFDYVLTTYGIVQRESRQTDRDALFRITWHRIVLDESHYIKNRSCATAKSVIKLRGKHRWCLTGTPFNTTVKDLHGQVAFLGLGLMDNSRVWSDVDNAVSRQMWAFRGDDNRSMKPVLRLMECMVMRHKKSQQFQGHPLLELPGIDNQVVEIEFTPEQAIGYKKLYEIAKKRYDHFVRTGMAVRRTLEVLQLLAPLRKACSFSEVNWAEIEAKLKEIDEMQLPPAEAAARTGELMNQAFHIAAIPSYNEDSECSICLDLPNNPLQTKCGHKFCGECITSLLQRTGGRGPCPLCRTPAKITELCEPARPVDDEEKKRQEEEEFERKKTECVVCKKQMINPYRTPCQHDACHQCLTTNIKQKGRCPTCRKIVDLASIVAAPLPAPPAPAAEPEPAPNARQGSVVMDAKVRYLMRELREIRRNKPQSKVLVFTQFTSTIANLKAQFGRENWPYQTLEGSMSMYQRSKSLHAFQTGEVNVRSHLSRNREPPFIFLLSIRAGGVGITLTSADHVFIMEPCLNIALERQAVNRAHRIGQKREVKVRRLVMAGSIEKRILEMKCREEKKEGDEDDSSSVPNAGNVVRDSRSVRAEEMAKFFKDSVEEVAGSSAPASPSNSSGSG